MGSKWWAILFLCGLASVAVAQTIGGGAITFPGVLSSAMCASGEILKKSGGGGTYWICDADATGGGGGGDAITVGGSAATDANFLDSTWIDAVLDTAPTPDTITLNVIAGSIGTTQVAALDAGDVTTGTFADAQINGSLESDEVVPTLAGDVDGASNANDIDEVSVEAELEGVMDLADMADGGNVFAANQLVKRNIGDAAFDGLTVNAGTDLTADLEEEAHASEHQNGGGDEVATATAGANAIPKAGAGGTLDNAWLDSDLAAIGALATTTGGRSILASTPADDQVYVGDTASAGTWRSIPDCGEAGTLNYTAATNSFSCLTDSGGGGGGITYADASAAHLAGF